jgi:hypothetical protein
VTGFHHLTTHHGNDPKKLEDVAKINVHHTELFSYLVQKMKGINDGKGTLLDNSMMLYGSAIGDGDRHNHDDLPISDGRQRRRHDQDRPADRDQGQHVRPLPGHGRARRLPAAAASATARGCWRISRDRFAPNEWTSISASSP